MKPEELESYSKFYRDATPKLVTFLMFLGLQRSDAADCVQEALISALPPRWETLDHPYAYCRTVAYRRSVDVRRQRREAPSYSLEGIGSPLVDADSGIIEFDELQELLDYLTRLGSETERAVLVWTYDGATCTEIGNALEMNPATVRSTLRNAREKLRRFRPGGERNE